MSERDRGMAIALLAEGFGVKLENLPAARILIYEKALQKVPAACLEPMAHRAIATRRPRFGDLPTVADLLEDAEAVRVELLRTMTFTPCVNCSQSGWREVEVEGVKRMTRCHCWTHFQAKVQALGVGHEPLALPAPEPAWSGE